MRACRLSCLTVLACLAGMTLPAAGRSAAPAGDAAVQRGLDGLVAAAGGPPGAIATLHRGAHTTVLRAGRADVRRPGAPHSTDRMRIASITKAFTGAVALHLVQEGRLGLDDTVARRLPGMPAAWSDVTVRQMLQHVSGLPDYTTSAGFFDHIATDPGAYVSPDTVLGWVRDRPMAFAPGTRYAYSNTDNIVVGLIVQAAAARPYRTLLDDIVFGPAALTRTNLPVATLRLRSPFLHGYAVAPGTRPQDVTQFINPSGAWASGAIVSTPRDLGAFVRALLSRRFFGPAQQAQQMHWVTGSSSPPGPGANAAGLALFRYRTRCGTVYGHTGNFPGYVQWAAATRDGRRSVTTSLNIPAPTGALLRRLRAVQETAVCALLGR